MLNFNLMNIDKVLNNKRLIKAVLGVIGGIKRYGAASHIFRNKKGIDDTFMNVCAGLWNLELETA
jgi:hypothetical protein